MSCCFHEKMSQSAIVMSSCRCDQFSGSLSYRLVLPDTACFVNAANFERRIQPYFTYHLINQFVVTLALTRFLNCGRKGYYSNHIDFIYYF